jgi:hypothetical protein
LSRPSRRRGGLKRWCPARNDGGIYYGLLAGGPAAETLHQELVADDLASSFLSVYKRIASAYSERGWRSITPSEASLRCSATSSSKRLKEALGQSHCTRPLGVSADQDAYPDSGHQEPSAVTRGGRAYARSPSIKAQPSEDALRAAESAALNAFRGYSKARRYRAPCSVEASSTPTMRSALCPSPYGLTACAILP